MKHRNDEITMKKITDQIMEKYETLTPLIHTSLVIVINSMVVHAQYCCILVNKNNEQSLQFTRRNFNFYKFMYLLWLLLMTKLMKKIENDKNLAPH